MTIFKKSSLAFAILASITSFSSFSFSDTDPRKDAASIALGTILGVAATNEVNYKYGSSRQGGISALNTAIRFF